MLTRVAKIVLGRDSLAISADLHADHIQIAAAIIEAAKTGDFDESEDLKIDWYENANVNANAIADFLSSARPTNWPAELMREVIKEHLDLTLDEAVAQLAGNYPASVKLYDQVHMRA